MFSVTALTKAKSQRLPGDIRMHLDGLSRLLTLDPIFTLCESLMCRIPPRNEHFRFHDGRRIEGQTVPNYAKPGGFAITMTQVQILDFHFQKNLEMLCDLERYQGCNTQ